MQNSAEHRGIPGEKVQRILEEILVQITRETEENLTQKADKECLSETR